MDLKPNLARFVGDGGEIYKGEFFFFAVGNARRTGSGTLVTPRAEVGDNKLDVVIVPALPRLDFLALLPDLRAAPSRSATMFYTCRPKNFEVKADGLLRVNADGEAMRGREFNYRILDRPLSVMVPWND